MNGLDLLLRLPHEPHPWDDLWRAIAVEHPVRDDWWEDRNLIPLLNKIEVPVYLGCDWENVPLHLRGVFDALPRLTNSPHVQVGMLGTHGLSWPWESLHIEALAWYDHWLKGHDTGILAGPRFRYALPGADDWHTADAWPPPGVIHREFALRADGALDEQDSTPGERAYMTLGAGLNRKRSSAADPPSQLEWTSAPLTEDLDVVGDIELRLDATSTALDTAWIVTLHDVDPAGEVTHVSAGYLRASLRAADETASRPGAPSLPCDTPQAVPIGELVHYRVPLVANARRFRAGHRIQLVLTSDDTDDSAPAVLDFRHASVGTSALNTVRSSSRLLLPVT
jgi:predicted acyl esterase